MDSASQGFDWVECPLSPPPGDHSSGCQYRGWQHHLQRGAMGVVHGGAGAGAGAIGVHPYNQIGWSRSGIVWWAWYICLPCVIGVSALGWFSIHWGVGSLGHVAFGEKLDRCCCSAYLQAGRNNRSFCGPVGVLLAMAFRIKVACWKRGQ